MLPHILLSLGMGGAVMAVQLLGLKDLPTLLIQIPLGIGLYLAGARLLKVKALDMIKGVLSSYLHRK